MGKIEKTVEFAAAPEKVWAVVADPSRFGDWLNMHKSWKGDVPTEFSKGAQVDRGRQPAQHAEHDHLDGRGVRAAAARCGSPAPGWPA